MTTNKTLRRGVLTHVFDVELRATRQSDPITSTEGRIGEFLGGGDGTLHGARLKGDIQWDLFCDHNGDLQFDCGNEIAGIIKTHDGAEVTFTMLGYARVPDESKAHIWNMAFATKFQTDHPKYRWLNTTLAHWTGEFDMQTYRHRYSVYA